MKKEKLKIAAGAALLTGLFAVGYMTVNMIAFAEGMTPYVMAETDEASAPYYAGDIESLTEEIGGSKIEIVLDDMQLTVFYYSEVGRSHRAPELELSHLSIEEIAAQIATAIDEEFDVSLDGHAIRLSRTDFVNSNNQDPDVWYAIVLAEAEEADQGEPLYYLVVDAKTGEIISEIDDLVENPLWGNGESEEGAAISLVGEDWSEEDFLASLTEEELRMHEEMIRLTTPEAHHLSEEEASAIAIQWIYEEFGFVIDVEKEHHDFGMVFTHEDMNGVGRSFWVAMFTEFGLAPDGKSFGSTPEGDSLIHHNFALNIDGITGERLVIRDESQPFQPAVIEVVLDQMQFTVLDHTHTGEGDVVNPAFVSQLQPYHLSVEEATTRMAEIVYEEVGVNIDGMTLRVSFMNGFQDDGLDTWGGFVLDGLEPGSEAFNIVIDARTGELVSEVMDTRHFTEAGAP